MNRIRKTILIDGSIARVWKHLTDPALIAGWLMPNDFEARAGHPFRLDCGTEGRIDCVLQEIVPRKRIVYSWNSPHLGVETTVTLTLAAAKGKTRLTLVHSGWDRLPPSQRKKSRPFDEGWGVHLRMLRDAVVAAKA